MTRHLFLTITLGAISVAPSARAANGPHAGSDRQNTLVWTNDDVEKLHVPGLICIVGRTNEETSTLASLAQPYVKARDPQWYAEQAERLSDELERRQTQLGEYRQAIEDAKSLKTMTGGINLEEDELGITLEAGIEILQQRVSEAQGEFDALEDLARRNDIPPGTLRGQ